MVMATTAVMQEIHRIKAVVAMIAVIRAIHPVKVRMETAAVTAVYPIQTEAVMDREECRQEDRAMHQETHRMPMACKISKIAIPIAAQDRTAAKANPL